MATTRNATESFNANGFETVLTASAGPTATTFNLASTQGLVAPFYMVINPDRLTQREYIFVDGNVTGTAVTTTTLDNRYLDGSAETSDITHLSSSIVRIAPTKQHFEDLWDAIGKVVNVDFTSPSAGAVSLNPSEEVVDVVNDSILFKDFSDDGALKKDTIQDFVSGIAGGGLTEAAGQLDVSVTTSEVDASTLVTSTDTIASNDNDTTIPTSAAVKDVTDNKLDLSGGTMTGDIEMGDNSIHEVTFEGFQEENGSGGAGSSFTIDTSILSVYQFQADANCTLNFTNVPTGTCKTILLRDSSTTAGYTFTYQVDGVAVTPYFSGGTAHTSTTGRDLITFISIGNGEYYVSAVTAFS